MLKDLSGSKNLLQRATLYRHKELLLGREDWSFEPDETMCRIWLFFFIDNCGLTNSFGLGSCMQRDMLRLHDLEPVRSPGKSMGESFDGNTVIQHDQIENPVCASHACPPTQAVYTQQLIRCS